MARDEVEESQPRDVLEQAHGKIDEQSQPVNTAEVITSADDFYSAVN